MSERKRQNRTRSERPGRNDLCPCGSGIKYKKCCGLSDRSYAATRPPIKFGRWRIENIKDLPPKERAIADQMNREVLADQFSGPRSISAQFQDYTFRAIGNRLHYTPQKKTYLDFIYDLLKHSLGKAWWDEQTALAPEKRHIVRVWNTSWHRSFQGQIPNAKSGAAYRVQLTGDGKELFTLADDLYRLQLAGKLPSKLMRRLRNREEFQGARYEIRVAAIMLRAGFEIEWADVNQAHCEFYAIHRHTKVKVAVEAKSRRRPGTYHTPATASAKSWSAGDVESLYNDAVSQNPGDRPFAVFIDVNLPPEPDKSPMQKSWVRDVMTMTENLPRPSEKDPDPVSMTAFTNYSWHFQGSMPAEQGEAISMFPLHAVWPIGDVVTIEALRNSIIRYGDLEEECPPQISEHTVAALLANSAE